MNDMDKATGAYEPFIQIPPGLDCRGPCPEQPKAIFVDFMVPLLSSYVAAREQGSCLYKPSREFINSPEGMRKLREFRQLAGALIPAPGESSEAK